MAFKKSPSGTRLEQYKSEIKGKVPPNNIEAEQSLLGAILLNHEMFDSVAAIVDTDDFYEPRHRNIFETMKQLNTESKAIDSLTVCELLGTKGLLETTGGASYVSSLADSIPSYENAKEYADIVRNKAILRNMISLTTAIAEASYREDMGVDEILRDAESMIYTSAQRRKKDSFNEVSDDVGDVYEQIIKKSKEPDVMTGLPTGYQKIDDCTQGLQPGELVIVAARPGVGKTSLVLNIAYKLAVHHKKNVLVYSFEMSHTDLIRRMLAVGSRVPLQKIRRGRIDSEDKANLMRVAGELSNTSFYIDTEDNNVFDMKAKTRSLKAELQKHGKTLDLVIVDYIQLVKPNENIPREQQISQISRSLKMLASEMKLPVIALSQLNREVEKREKNADKASPPKLSDLRESGAIEQDADIVLFIHRDSKDPVTTTETYESGNRVDRQIIKCKLIIAKNRNGPIEEQKVAFIPELTAFEQVSGLDNDEAGYAGTI
jgi:replicative DNA helicase